MAETRSRQRPPERDDDVFAVRVRVTAEQAAALVAREDVDHGDRPHVRRLTDEMGLLDLFVTGHQLGELRSEGFEIEVVNNQSERARERRAEIGEGDRFEGGRVPPTGIGRKIGGRRREERRS